MKNETIEKDFNNGNYLDINNYFNDVQIYHNKECLEFIIKIRDKILLNLDFKNIHLMTYQSMILIYLIFKNKQTNLFKLDSGFYINLENYHFEISEDSLIINLKLRDDDILIQKEQLTKSLFRLNFKFFCRRTLRKVKLKILYKSSQIFHNNNLKLKFINSFKNFYLSQLKEKYKTANYIKVKKKIIYSSFYNKIILNKAFYWKKFFFYKLNKKYFQVLFFLRIKFKKKQKIIDKLHFSLKEKEFVTNIANIKYFNTISFFKRIIYYKNIKCHKDDMSRKVASYLLKSKFFKKLKQIFIKRKEIYNSIDNLYYSRCALKIFIHLKSQVSKTNKTKSIQTQYNYINYLFLHMCLESHLQINAIVGILKSKLIKKRCHKHINTILDLFYNPKLKSIFYNLKYFSQRKSIMKINFGMIVKNYYLKNKILNQKKIRNIQSSINIHRGFVKYFIRKHYILKLKTAALKEKQIKQSKSLGYLVFKRNVFITFVNNCRGFVFDKLNKVISQNIFQTNRLRFYYNLFIYNIYNKPFSLISPKNKGLTKRKSYYLGFKRRLSLRIGFIRLMLRTNERKTERHNIREYKHNHIFKTNEFFRRVYLLVKEKKFFKFKKKNHFYSFLKKVNNNKTKKLYYKTIDENLNYKTKLKILIQLKNNMVKIQNKRNKDQFILQKFSINLKKFYLNKTKDICRIQQKLKNCENSLIVLRKLFYFSHFKRIIINRTVKEISNKFYKKNLIGYLSLLMKMKKNSCDKYQLFGRKLRKIYFYKLKNNKDQSCKTNIKKNCIMRINFRSMIKHNLMNYIKAKLKLNKLKIIFFKRLFFFNIFRKGMVHSRIANKEKLFYIKLTLTKLKIFQVKNTKLKSTKLRIKEISKSFYLKKTIKFLSTFKKIMFIVKSFERFIYSSKLKLFQCFIHEIKSILNLSSLRIKSQKETIKVLKDVLIRKKVDYLFNKLIDFYKKKKYLHHILKVFIKDKQFSIKSNSTKILFFKIHFKNFYKNSYKLMNLNNIKKDKYIKYFHKIFTVRLKALIINKNLFNKRKYHLEINNFLRKQYLDQIKKNIEKLKKRKIILMNKQEVQIRLLFNIIKDNYLSSKYLKFVEKLSNRDDIIDRKRDIINNFENIFS